MELFLQSDRARGEVFRIYLTRVSIDTDIKIHLEPAPRQHTLLLLHFSAELERIT